MTARRGETPAPIGKRIRRRRAGTWQYRFGFIQHSGRKQPAIKLIAVIILLVMPNGGIPPDAGESDIHTIFHTAGEPTPQLKKHAITANKAFNDQIRAPEWMLIIESKPRRVSGSLISTRCWHIWGSQRRNRRRVIHRTG
uniref:Uncharacterized protein n=1 Tax=Salmonella sp. TaxID=599 RepID=A0A482ET92_SALSP|nr:hypothetical protein NNIBIDOC_00087 [Salmonella sp.]